ncbi:glycoside hydrolase N-terminal domain-containing protein [Streptococcus sp. E29BA]|uniref:glycosyl hydrolase family 95 catalytic domain-containing protein n=1 Tax=Streptococcus sp. E29BA TaxID=3278716 RepID=UPI00359E5C0D
MRQHLFSKKSHFSIRKLGIGVCSVIIGTSLFGQMTVQADESGSVTTDPVPAGRADASHSAEAESRSEAPAIDLDNKEEPATESVQVQPEVVDSNSYTLHYERPAATTYQGWESEALPIGNGEMGAKIFGLVGAEKIQFNEKTLWSGGPTPDDATYNGGNLANKHEYLPQIREALEKGDLTTAKRLAETHLKGPYDEQYGRYLAFGDVFIDFTNQEKTLDSVTDYHRDLDIKTAISRTSYKQADTTFSREHFSSFPDDVTVTHLTKEGEKSLDFEVSMRLTTDWLKNQTTYDENKRSSYKTGEVTYSDEGILLSGEVTNNKMRFASFLSVDTDGELTRHEDKLSVRGASYATLLLTAKTDFAQNPKTNYRRPDANVVSEVKAIVAKAKQKTYEQLKETHVADYKTLFDRVKLNLTDKEMTASTDRLLRDYRPETGQELEELFFQYGRYLMITSSRDRLNALPANLQGVWNAVDNPSWNSDYHLNVNLQMNYWPVYSTNIAETALPLINYIDDMRYYGRIAAKEYGGIESRDGEENGWLAHTQATPFGWTTPGWNYYWGWSPASNAWIMQNVYDYYKFTQDKDYLERKIYPMLKETAKFWNSFLHYDQASDRYVSSPSYSPEHGSISIGNTFDQSLIWQLFHDYMEAAEILGKDAEFVKEIKVKFDKLKPLHINNAGRIKEWYEEDTPAFTGEGVQANHRHVSELVGLFPGTLFSKDQPDYLEAAKATLNARGDGGTGWSKANKINLWARLLDGNRAHRLLAEQLRGSTLTNLWDTHTPFQIDGNFGATSGITEMLLQSHTGYIAPLAALPDAWKTGQVSGLVARGNVEVAMAWQEKNLTHLTLQAKSGGKLQIDYPRIETATVTINGLPASFRRVQADRIEIETTAGDVVFIRDVLGRITDLRAERTGEGQAKLIFSPIDKATYYRIERVARDEAGRVADTKTFTTVDPIYRDTRVLPSHHYAYRVQAVLSDTLSTAWSDPANIADVKLILDDRDSSIRYGAIFGNWADNSLYGGTEKFGDLTGRQVSEADRTVIVPFVGTGIQVYGLKHSGLGKALVYVDNEARGELDFYGTSGVQKGVLIGQIDGLTDGAHELKLVIDNRPATRTNERNKISLDYFRVLTENSGSSEVLDDRDPRVTYGSVFGNWSDNVLYGGTEKYADITGSQRSEADRTATLTFTGTGIQIFGLKSTALGKATVTIDGQAVAPLLFNKASGDTEKSVLIGEYRNLSDGEHTIALTVAPESINNSRHKISLDKFVILKSPLEQSYPATLEDIGAQATYFDVTLPTGEWTTVEVLLPEQAEPIRIQQTADGIVVSGTSRLEHEATGIVRLTLPPQQVAGPVRVVTYQTDEASGTAVALLARSVMVEHAPIDGGSQDESNSGNPSGDAGQNPGTPGDSTDSNTTPGGDQANGDSQDSSDSDDQSDDSSSGQGGDTGADQEGKTNSDHDDSDSGNPSGETGQNPGTPGDSADTNTTPGGDQDNDGSQDGSNTDDQSDDASSDQGGDTGADQGSSDSNSQPGDVDTDEGGNTDTNEGDTSGTDQGEHTGADQGGSADSNTTPDGDQANDDSQGDNAGTNEDSSTDTNAGDAADADQGRSDSGNPSDNTGQDSGTPGDSADTNPTSGDDQDNGGNQGSSDSDDQSDDESFDQNGNVGTDEGVNAGADEGGGTDAGGSADTNQGDNTTKPDTTQPPRQITDVNPQTDSGIIAEVQSADAKVAGLRVVFHKETDNPETPAILKGTDYDLFDIELVDKDGNVTKSTAPVDVYLPIDDGKDVAQVVYLPNSDQSQSLSFTTVTRDGKRYAKFTAEHFSEYGIIYKTPSATAPQAPHQGGDAPIHGNISRPATAPVGSAPASAIAGKNVLPATGDAHTALAAIGATALLSALGLAGLRRRAR